MGRYRDAQETVLHGEDPFALALGARIREARQQRGLSLAGLAGAEFSRSFLSLVERGLSGISLRGLALIAERLDLPVSYFFEDMPADRLAELRLDQAEAALLRDEPDGALRLLQDLDVPPARQPRALLLRGEALLAEGQAEAALSVLREGISLAEKQRNAAFLPQLSYALGAALYSTYNYDEALAQLNRALELALPEDRVLQAKATVCIGHILCVRGDDDAAIQHYRRGRELLQSISDLKTLGSVYAGLSQAYEHKGDLENALRYAKLSLGAFGAKQNARLTAVELNNLAYEYQELGNLDEALTCARDAVARAQQLGAADVEAAARSTLAAIYLKLGDEKAAEQEAEAAQTLAPGTRDPALADSWAALGKIAEQRGDTARADELYQQALQLLRDTNRHAAYARHAREYSLLLRERGDTERALEYATEAASTKLSNAS